MRITEWIYLGCVALLLGFASCSGELPDSDENDLFEHPVTVSYLSVNLLSGGQSSGAGASRADNGTYIPGNSDENTVHSVRFYFFKADGEAAYVKRTNNSFVNYLEWESPTTSDPSAPEHDLTNIEKIVNVQLVINTLEGDELPAQIIAVINPPADMPVIGSIDDADAINSITADYSVAPNADRFVMSNSVYVSAAGKKMEAVPVAGHIFPNPETALRLPATIYVERVNAKATLTCELKPTGGDSDGNTYDTGVKINDLTDKNLNPGKIGVKFLAWDVTQATDHSYLMKHIDEEWSDTEVFGSTTGPRWNYPDGFRSFWAINPALTAPKQAQSNYIFKSFDQHKSAVEDFGEGKENYIYIQENAAHDAESGCSYPTQLIIAAQLVDETGAGLTFAEYGFFQYTVEGLKTAMAENAELYKEAAEGGELVKIDGSDLELLSATEAGMASAAVEGRYWVYAAVKGTRTDEGTLNSDALTDYYTGSGQDARRATYAEANSRLAEDCGHAKLWQDGYTYYYTDIRHLGGIKAATDTDEAVPSNGAYGIVRNHVYALNITSLSGLGTPVYRPEEVIYPEKPDEEETYIGADIKILTWRVVHQSESFAW